MNFSGISSLSHAFSSCRKSWNQVVKPILPSSAQVLKVITWFRNHVALLPLCNSMNFHWRFSQAGKSTLADTIKRGRNYFREWDTGAHSSLVHVVFSSPLKSRKRDHKNWGWFCVATHLTSGKGWVSTRTLVSLAAMPHSAPQRFVSLPSLLLSCGPPGSASISALVLRLDFVC